MKIYKFLDKYLMTIEDERIGDIDVPEHKQRQVEYNTLSKEVKTRLLWAYCQHNRKDQVIGFK